MVETKTVNSVTEGTTSIAATGTSSVGTSVVIEEEVVKSINPAGIVTN